MGLWTIFCWLIYGILVGGIARWIHPGKDPEGFLPTILIGICGSFLGGVINFALGWGVSPLQSSGFVMGILGGVVCCALYRWYKDNSED